VSGGATVTEQRRRENALARAGRFGALGFEFAGTVVAGVVAGYYLDGWLHTAPLFTLLLTFAGMGGALYRLLWMLKRISSQSNDGG
jgi:F0F1-type ATP synthase assembly protein I